MTVSTYPTGSVDQAAAALEIPVAATEGRIHVVG